MQIVLDILAAVVNACVRVYRDLVLGVADVFVLLWKQALPFLTSLLCNPFRWQSWRDISLPWALILVVVSLHVLYLLWYALGAAGVRVLPQSRLARAAWDRAREVRRFAGLYYLLLPTFLLLVVFNFLPAVSIFRHAFYKYDIGGVREYIGFGNFAAMAHDANFFLSVQNMFKFIAFSLATSLTIPPIVAGLIFHLRSERSRYAMRVLFVVPMVVPAVVFYLIWLYIYQDSGIIALFFESIGLGDLGRGLLTNPKTARLAVMFVGFPFVYGVNLLIYYAGLMNIPQSLHDAAKVDGAGSIRTFLRVDIPMVVGQFKLLLILGIINGLQMFQNILVLTRGGPGFETMVPGMYMYRFAFAFNRMGYACAIGVVLFVVVFIITLLNARLIRSSAEYGTA
jgi:raffinose/stachyose/melibiose transport system permease protein